VRIFRRTEHSAAYIARGLLYVTCSAIIFHDPGTARAQTIELERIDVEALPAERADGPVDGYSAQQSATATKTATPILETPQAINVVTSDQIQDQGAQSVGQALRYTPGVTTEPNGSSSVFDETRVRGFEPLQYLDGLRLPLYQFFAAPRIEPYGLERIEVLKGPGSMLFGQNSPGGLINMVSKRPTEQALHEVQLQTGSYDRLQGAFDLGGPIDAQKTWLYRLTGLVRDADTVVDFTRDNRYFLAPALTYQPSADTRLTFLAQFGRDEGNFPQNFLPAQGTLLFNPNGRIPASRFWGEPDYDRLRRNQYSVGYDFEHRFNDTWTVRQNLRYASVDVDFKSFYPFGLDADLRTLLRGASAQQIHANAFTVDNQLQAEFVTGALRHTALFGVDYLRSSGDYVQDFGFASSIDIFAPVYGAPIPSLAPRLSSQQNQDQIGVYAQDQIKFGGWTLTFGGRHDTVSSTTEDQLALTSVTQDDDAFTGRVGIGYLFGNGIAPYASYATSFQPTIGTDRNGDPFAPTTGRQYEVGIKYRPSGSNALITLAAFDTIQHNALTPDPVDPNFSVQTGEIRVRGIEIEGKGKVTPNLEVIASYAYLDSEITQSTNPAEVGNRVPLVLRQQASLWGFYTFDSGPLAGLGLGAGVRFIGDSYSEATNSIPIPSYTLVDAAVHYELGRLFPELGDTKLSITATNLFDKYHVTYCFGLAYCTLGAGRVVLATMTHRW
jgi:iron complex outermembrane receptor protein